MRLARSSHGRRVAAKRAAGKLLGPRIAQRILLGYVLPLAVLLAFGFVLPIFLWSYLGGAVYNYEERYVMAERAEALQRAVTDSEAHAYGYLRYHDPAFRQRFNDARQAAREHQQELNDYASRIDNAVITGAVQAAENNFIRWNRTASQLFRTRISSPSDGPEATTAATQARQAFQPVEVSLMRLTHTLDTYRDVQKPIARAYNILRHITSVVVPLVAVILSLLIGRSIALGITRPLEALIHASEQLTLGRGEHLPSEMPLSNLGAIGAGAVNTDDEIGDLQRSFGQMARTIEQRETVLRAQNEAARLLHRRMEAVLNATDDGILLIDRAGGFAVVNQRLAALFGLQVAELEDHTWEQAGSLLLARFRNKAAVREQFREILAEPDAVTDETFEVEGPGALRTLRVYSAPVRGSGANLDADNEHFGRIFVFRDVTRDTMVDRMKTEFVSTVSHELRTPLTAIKGYVDLIVGGQTGPLTPTQTEFLTLVQSSTRRLTNLINDMLDISRIESGRIELRRESVDYVEVVQQAVRLMQNEADARQISLTLQVTGENAPDGPFPLVSGDADRITQVLTNFLSNGIKYTPPGGSVSVRIEFEDHFVTTCVADTGIGISLEDQRRLFQKFFRADNSTTREVGGTGLGLAITKAILEKLHGSVWVESDREKGPGSRFWFTLPTVEAPSPDAPPLLHTGTPVQESSLLPPTSLHRLVLSLDGDTTLLHRMGSELRRQGFVTSNAANMHDALRRARDLRPDLITLDLLSPSLDGWDVLRTLHANSATRGIPVALITPQTVSGQTLLLDSVEFLPRHAPDARLETTLRNVLTVALHRAAHGEPAALTLLLLGEETTAHNLRQRLSRLAPNATIEVVDTPEEAERRTGRHELLSDALILDTALLPGEKAGAWIAQLRRRHPASAAVPLVLLTEDDVSADEVYSLVPLGTGTLALEEMGKAIHALLERIAAQENKDRELLAGR